MWFARPDPQRPKVGTLPLRAFALVIFTPLLAFAIMLLWFGIGLTDLTFAEALVALIILAGIITAICTLGFVLFELGIVRIEGLEQSEDEAETP